MSKTQNDGYYQISNNHENKHKISSSVVDPHKDADLVLVECHRMLGLRLTKTCLYWEVNKTLTSSISWLQNEK